MRIAPRAVTLVLMPAMLLGCNKPKPPGPPPETPKPVATLTAEELLGEYQKNEVGADQKFKEKLIQVSGTVAGIKKAPLLGYYVGLGSAQEADMYDIMCFLDPSAEADAGQLKIGDKVTVMGMCKGKAAGLQLHLRQCAIVKETK
jgi:tRNA_anti-like